MANSTEVRIEFEADSGELETVEGYLIRASQKGYVEVCVVTETQRDIVIIPQKYIRSMVYVSSGEIKEGE